MTTPEQIQKKIASLAVTLASQSDFAHPNDTTRFQLLPDIGTQGVTLITTNGESSYIVVDGDVMYKVGSRNDGPITDAYGENIGCNSMDRDMAWEQLREYEEIINHRFGTQSSN